jgi:hypothetical protein
MWMACAVAAASQPASVACADFGFVAETEMAKTVCAASLDASFKSQVTIA